jgi:hypothetical protein
MLFCWKKNKRLSFFFKKKETRNISKKRKEIKSTFNISSAFGRASMSFSKHFATKSLKGADHLPGSFNPGIPLVVIRNNA